MGTLQKGVIEHLAKELSANIAGDKEVRYSITKYFEISDTLVFELHIIEPEDPKATHGGFETMRYLTFVKTLTN